MMRVGRKSRSLLRPCGLICVCVFDDDKRASASAQRLLEILATAAMCLPLSQTHEGMYVL
jgi:hypothetical protein